MRRTLIRRVVVVVGLCLSATAVAFAIDGSGGGDARPAISGQFAAAPAQLAGPELSPSASPLGDPVVARHGETVPTVVGKKRGPGKPPPDAAVQQHPSILPRPSKAEIKKLPQVVVRGQENLRPQDRIKVVIGDKLPSVPTLEQLKAGSQKYRSQHSDQKTTGGTPQ